MREIGTRTCFCQCARIGTAGKSNTNGSWHKAYCANASDSEKRLNDQRNKLDALENRALAAEKRMQAAEQSCTENMHTIEQMNIERNDLERQLSESTDARDRAQAQFQRHLEERDLRMSLRRY